MNLKRILEVLGAEMLTGHDPEATEVTVGCGADLMSDVLAHMHAGAFLLTRLTNRQTIRTAEIAGIKAICFVGGKRPMPEVVELAAHNEIPLMATGLRMYESCGRLYQEGLPDCSKGS
jgi:predicted transcriptional regulator